MHYVVIAILAAVVVVFAWIVLEAKIKFRRRSRAISNAVTCLPDDSGTKERPARRPDRKSPNWLTLRAAVLAIKAQCREHPLAFKYLALQRSWQREPRRRRRSQNRWGR